MILAAGRGERLRPLTDRIPKSLIEVGGRALIEHHLIALSAVGIREIIINLAWLGNQIEQRLGDGRAYGVSIAYSRETEGALETAGGIRHALPLIGEKPLIVVSSDVLTDFPFASLLDREPPGFAHLVLIDNPPHHPDGDFGLSQGQITRDVPRRTYSGIGVFRPRSFLDLPAGAKPLRPLFEAAIDAGQLSGEHYKGSWRDVGSPQRLSEARAAFDNDPRRVDDLKRG